MQPLATSERSGITFTASPVEPGAGELEAVWGLGEGLVSGRIDPDRWTIHRLSGAILAHAPGPRDQTMTLRGARVEFEAIADSRGFLAYLKPDEVGAVWALALSAEERFGVHPRTASGPTTTAARCWSNRVPSPPSQPTHARHGRVPS